MEVLKNVLNALTSAGATVMMPIIIFVIGLCFKIRPMKALKAGITVGVGFIGVNAIVGVLTDAIGPASQAMITNWRINLNVIDLGWAVTAAISWGSVIVPLVFITVLIINLLMVITGLTKTLDVDIWNYWSFIFSGALIYYSSNNLLLSVIAADISAIVYFKCADFAYPLTKDMWPGCSFPHGCSISWAPYAVLGNKLLDHVPGINKIHADPESLQKKIGFFGEPMFIGIVIGGLMGIFASYSITKIMLLSMTMAACMLIMPKMVALLMEGLSTIASGAQTFARSSKIFKGRDILIGIDGAIVMSYPGCIAVGTLMVPLSLVIALLLPGNHVLPFADMVVFPIWFAWNTVAAKGNIVRGLILSCIMCVFTLLIATNLAPLTTAMAKAVGYAFPEGATQITSMSVGQHLASWVIVKVFSLFA